MFGWITGSLTTQLPEKETKLACWLPVGVSVTVLPILNPLLHNVPQVIPAGDDEIDPKSEPVPLFITCKFPVVPPPVKVAEHVLGAFITTEALA
jgi:hypothetical protein